MTRHYCNFRYAHVYKTLVHGSVNNAQDVCVCVCLCVCVRVVFIMDIFCVKDITSTGHSGLNYEPEVME